MIKKYCFLTIHILPIAISIFFLFLMFVNFITFIAIITHYINDNDNPKIIFIDFYTLITSHTGKVFARQLL